jgi:ferric-dicitrate binding protein FerR (iron transport regulator)
MSGDRVADSSSRGTLERAAYWYVRVQDGSLDAVERRRFLSWYRGSPENRREFHQLDVIWGLAPALSELETLEPLLEYTFNWRMSDAWRDSVCPILRLALPSRSMAHVIGRFDAAVPAFLL